jgi:uncharacterized protein YaiI (UPF0178 family)
MKGIVITKMVIIAAIVLAAVLYILNQQGQLDLSKIGAPAAKQTTIKSTEQASNQITDIGSGVENVGSILEDIYKSLG